MFLSSSYNIQESEKQWQRYWSDKEIYKWDESCIRSQNFSIDTPPPTVSGLLHMGHIFSYTQTDFIARYQRMRGMNVFYPMGFDDNGLPTERLVEKVKKIRAAQMPRSDFIRLCQEVASEAEEEFYALFQSVALSVDWTQKYQTISSKSCTLSQMSFIDLYNKGYIYRKKAPTFWDPIDLTALAQTEIEDKEQRGLMVNIVFSGPNQEEIIIATTRPELIPACVALLYYPGDTRYEHLKGQKAVTPLFNVSVPIIPDEEVDPEKGTGLVMTCTFGDIQDIHWWRRHNLPTISCIDNYGRMVNADFLNGLKVKEARSMIIDKLQAQSLLKDQVEVVQFVKCAERSGAPLEILVNEQWYISVLDAKEQIIEKAHQCNWYPEYMRVRLDNWVYGLNQDWCISRQRYFGIPFPVWYSLRPGEEGKVILPDITQLPVDPLIDLPVGYQKHEVKAETDVMDTWATSAISPQLSSEGIADTLMLNKDKHQKLYPFDLRPQAHEIIRVWAFGSLVKSMYHENTIPWKNLMISGWCLAADKTKMSKSKGNVITPRDLLIEKGADVVRYWASTAKLGVDITYSEEAFKLGKRFLTKLWNAAKFCFIHLNEAHQVAVKLHDQSLISETLDIWIVTKLKQTIIKATIALDSFEYCDARVATENFLWLFCDQYLELAKHRLYNNKTEPSGHSALATIFHSLLNMIKLLAPFMPHVTEEIFQGIFKEFYPECNSIHNKGNWPNAQELERPEAVKAIAIGDATISILELIRKFKSQGSLSLKAQVDAISIYQDNVKLDKSSLYDLQHASHAIDVHQIEDEKNHIGEIISELQNNIKVSIGIKIN